MFGKIIKAEKIGQNLKVNILLESNPDYLEKIAKMQGQEVNVIIKRQETKRSLSQNNLIWALINDMARVLQTSPNTVHVTMIKRYCPCDILTIGKDVDIERFARYYEFYKENTINGKEFVAWKVFKGTSELVNDGTPNGEATLFINNLIEEAKELGIDTEQYGVLYEN